MHLARPWHLGSLHDLLTSLLISAILTKFRTDNGIGWIWPSAANHVISSKFQNSGGRNPLGARAKNAYLMDGPLVRILMRGIYLDDKAARQMRQ